MKIAGLFLLEFAWTAAFCCAQAPGGAVLRLNQIQVIGSHNSYHAGLPPSQFSLLRKDNPSAADALEYSHPPLDQQLSAGVRQIEIDIFADSKGGRFADPAGPKMVAQAGLPADPPFDSAPMSKPGFKVMHVQDIDFRSNCQPFTACLSTVRNWSKAHPNHLPIFILIENKDDNPRLGVFTEPEPFTSMSFDALDREIRSVFSPSEMITPDDVRGKYATLNEAIRTAGWPTLDSARGKVLFLMDQRRVEDLYASGHPSLEGRAIFTNALPGRPDAAFVEVNDPAKEPGLIASLVREGYLVRTRTDEPTVQARSGDTAQRDAAFKSGAQILSTDYPFHESSRWTGYSVGFPDGAIARCNPALIASTCALR
jgi:hypothetical protein